MHLEIWRSFGGEDDHEEDGLWELFETDRSDTDLGAE